MIKNKENKMLITTHTNFNTNNNNHNNKRIVSAIENTNFTKQNCEQNNDVLKRCAISSNPILQNTRSDEIDILFKVKSTGGPEKFVERWKEENFKTFNAFSEHDNRNVIQNYGEYFGRGYGKKLIDTGFYRTDPSHLSHEPVDPPSYLTTTKFHFQPGKTTEVPKLYRRFPRDYKDRTTNHIFNETDCEKYDITTQVLKQFKDKLIYKTPKQILVDERYRKLANEPWKYSYKRENTVYPNIKLQQIRKSCIDLSKY